MMTSPGHAQALGRTLFAACAAIFLLSASVLAVEIVAGRLVAPFVGQSLYSWTSILGVLLGGMAVGHLLGGWLAERYPSPVLIGSLLASVGMLCASLPFVNASIGRFPPLAALPWPLRTAGHVSCVLLFPAVAFGMLSPPLTRMAILAAAHAGYGFGLAYAAGGLGSVCGAWLTGFVLVPQTGVRAILLGVAFLCAALAPLARVMFRGFSSTANVTGRPATFSSDSPMPIGVYSRPTPRGFLIAGAMGLTMMMTEVAAGRLVAELFGHSLYTWAAVITVFLAGMAIGSALSGWMSRRVPLSHLTGLLIVWTSLIALATPFWNTVVGDWMVLWGLSWPWRIGLHTALVYLPTALLLGMIAPLTAVWVYRQACSVGRMAGSLHATVSAGGVVGGLIAAFLLVEWIGVRGIFAAASLVLAAAGLLLRDVRRWTFPGCVAALWFLLGLRGVGPGPRAAAHKARFLPSDDPFLLYARESAYYSIRVRSNSYYAGVRELYLDTLKHTEVNVSNPLELRRAYHRLFAAVMAAHSPPPTPLRVLVLGGGGYAFPRYVEWTRPESQIDVVEIDPAVTHAAFAGLALPRTTSIRTFATDAGAFLRDRETAYAKGKASDRYDVVIGDCFNDWVVPPHLVTLEFCQRVRRQLTPGGLYVWTVIDQMSSGRLVGAAYTTCTRVFPSVVVLRTHGAEKGRDTFVLVCSPDGAAGERPREILRATLPEGASLVAPDTLRHKGHDLVLTDDYAPVEALLAPLVRTLRMPEADRHFHRAVRLWKAGDLCAAATECAAVLGLRPQAPEAHDLLAVCLAEQGRIGEAIDHWQQALALDPSLVSVRDNLACAYFRIGRFADALHEWEKILRSHPEMAPRLQEKCAAARCRLQDRPSP